MLGSAGEKVPFPITFRALSSRAPASLLDRGLRCPRPQRPDSEALPIQQTDSLKIDDEAGTRLLEGIEVWITVPSRRGEGHEVRPDRTVEVVEIGETPVQCPELRIGEEGRIDKAERDWLSAHVILHSTSLAALRPSWRSV